MSNRIERQSLGLTLAAITLLLWGALPVVLKLLLKSLDPFTVTWYRFLLAGAMLVPVIHFRYGLASPFRIRGAALALFVSSRVGAFSATCFAPPQVADKESFEYNSGFIRG